MPKQAKPPTKAPTFSPFRRLPVELQTIIFTEALRKPQLHHVKLKKRPSENHREWTVGMYAAGGPQTDDSGHRLSTRIAEVNDVAAKAVQLATGRGSKHVLPLTRSRDGEDANMDASTDLVFFQLANDHNWPVNPWHASSQIFHVRLDRTDVISVFSGIRKVALTYNPTVISCSNAQYDYAFKCRGHSDNFDGGNHGHWTMCPQELVGFLDCFPHLEAVYLVYKPSSRKKEWTSHVSQYAKWFFSRRFCQSSHVSCTSPLSPIFLPVLLISSQPPLNPKSPRHTKTPTQNTTTNQPTPPT